MKTAIIIIWSVLFALSVLTVKVSGSLTVKELRRRARSGHDANAAAVYKMVAYGRSLDLFLWLVAATAAAALFLMAANYNSWLGVAAVLLISSIVLTDKKFTSTDHIAWRVVTVVAPAITSILSFVRPVVVRIPDRLKSLRQLHIHTGVYEKEDLLDLVKAQIEQPDNRIPEEDLNVVAGALTFGDKTVGSIMTPRRIVKFVSASDAVGPLLMDELHASGFSRFPVVKDSLKAANPTIVGTLYLKDLVGHEGKGKVSDVMNSKVYFINEAQNLREALAVFLKTQHHLLVVVNNFEEISGVISTEDVIEQILGAKIVDEFDQYDDLRAVAAHEAQKEHHRYSQRASTEVE